MTDKEWKHYVDTGKVSYNTIKDIVERIKNGETLGIKDLAIYNSNADMIEVLLKKKQNITKIYKENRNTNIQHEKSTTI